MLFQFLLFIRELKIVNPCSIYGEWYDSCRDWLYCHRSSFNFICNMTSFAYSYHAILLLLISRQSIKGTSNPYVPSLLFCSNHSIWSFLSLSLYSLLPSLPLLFLLTALMTSPTNGVWSKVVNVVKAWRNAAQAVFVSHLKKNLILPVLQDVILVKKKKINKPLQPMSVCAIIYIYA